MENHTFFFCSLYNKQRMNSYDYTDNIPLLRTLIQIICSLLTRSGSSSKLHPNNFVAQYHIAKKIYVYINLDTIRK